MMNCYYAIFTVKQTLEAHSHEKHEIESEELRRESGKWGLKCKGSASSGFNCFKPFFLLSLLLHSTTKSSFCLILLLLHENSIFILFSHHDDVVEQTELLLKQISALNYSRSPSFENLVDLIQVRMMQWLKYLFLIKKYSVINITNEFL